MYTIQKQKTYLGKTAGGHLKRAEVVKMAAGNFEIWLPNLGAIAILTVLGDMVLDFADGKKICLTTSDRAERNLRRLEAKIERLYTAE